MKTKLSRSLLLPSHFLVVSGPPCFLPVLGAGSLLWETSCSLEQRHSCPDTTRYLPASPSQQPHLLSRCFSQLDMLSYPQKRDAFSSMRNVCLTNRDGNKAKRWLPLKKYVAY